LQEKELIRLGGRTLIPLNVRIICATNRPLFEQVQSGQFREDLYYRINVLQIHVPPLRERSADIVPLFRHLLLKYGLLPEQADTLVKVGQHRIHEYRWPGNIRELENFAQRLAALTTLAMTPYELAAMFHDVFLEYISQPEENPSVFSKPKDTMPVPFAQAERNRIVAVLVECNGSKQKAAQKLGISRTTLWRKMKEYDIDV
jgi:propionate catabolism operon transcriptional regulator